MLRLTSARAAPRRGRRQPPLTPASLSSPVGGRSAIALVTNNNDDQNLGRVKLKYPWLDDTLESGWVAAFAHSSDPTASVRLVVRGCQVDRNAYGLYAQSEAGGGVVLIASGNIVAHTAYEALAADGIGTMAWASGNTISNNGTGLAALNGGIFESAGDNAVRHNNVGKFGTITVVATE